MSNKVCHSLKQKQQANHCTTYPPNEGSRSAMSYNGEGSSESDAQFRSAKISVWWDIENCQVGRAVDPCAIAQNINSSLKKMNYTGAFFIFAYGDIELIPPLTQQALSNTAVQLNHVPPTPGVKDGSDKMILVDMMLWAADNPAPANVLLISGDRDFAYALHQLKNKGYNVLLAHPKQPSAFLAAVAPTAWLWTDLMVGGEPVTKRELQQVDTNGSNSNLSVSEVQPNQSPSLVPISANDLCQDSVKEGNSKLNVNKGRRKGKQSQKILKSVQRSSSESEGITENGNMPDSGFSQASPVANSESHQLGSNTSTLPISLQMSAGFKLMSGNTDPENSGAGRGSPESSQAVLNTINSVIAPVEDHVDAEAAKKNSDFGKGSLPHLDCNSNLLVSDALPSPGTDPDPINPNTPENSNQGRLPPAKERDTCSQRGKRSQRFPQHFNMSHTNSSPPLPVSDFMSKNTIPENSVQGCPKTPASQGRGTFRQNGKQPQRFSGRPDFSRSVTMPADNQRNTNSSNSHKSDSCESGSQVQQLGCNLTIPVSEALVTPSIVFDLTSPNTLSGNIAKGYSAFPSNVNAFASSSKNITGKLVRNESVDKYQDTETGLRGTTGTPKMPINDEQAALAVRNILFALKILRKEKIMPTKENIADSILYANVDFPTVNINKALETAIEHQLIQKNNVGTWELYLGKNERQWMCINPSGGNPHQFPSETWSAIRFRLTQRCSRLAILESKSRYEAATILHKLCLKGYLLGEVLQILEILISSKKWISYNHLDCLPFTINLPEEEPRSEGNCTIS